MPVYRNRTIIEFRQSLQCIDKRQRASATVKLDFVVSRQLLTLATNFAVVVIIRRKKKMFSVFGTSHVEASARLRLRSRHCWTLSVFVAGLYRALFDAFATVGGVEREWEVLRSVRRMPSVKTRSYIKTPSTPHIHLSRSPFARRYFLILFCKFRKQNAE